MLYDSSGYPLCFVVCRRHHLAMDYPESIRQACGRPIDYYDRTVFCEAGTVALPADDGSLEAVWRLGGFKALEDFLRDSLEWRIWIRMRTQEIGTVGTPPRSKYFPWDYGDF